MAHIVEFDKDGNIIYKGMLSSSEILLYDQLIETLKSIIPQLEQDLKDQYGDSIMYKYNLGKLLGEILEKNNVSIKERRRFWDEIKALATTEKRTRNEGKNSKKRSFFEQCYRLSQIDKDTVKKLSWRQWVTLFDRSDKNTDDRRFFIWIRNYPKKIREDEWREFMKVLNLYLDKTDTSVFSDAELFEIYNSMIIMANIWLSEVKEFKKTHPASRKLKSLSSWSKKFYKNCFSYVRNNKTKISKELCLSQFVETMM